MPQTSIARSARLCSLGHCTDARPVTRGISHSRCFMVGTLGNLLRRLVLPVAIQSWSQTSLQQRLFKTGGRLIRHARYFVLQLAESYLTSTLFRQTLGRIERLASHPT
jgi:Transposase DDE domain group 1